MAKSKQIGSITVTIVGIHKLNEEMKRLLKVAPKAFGNAVYSVANGIFNESQKQVPVDTSNLQKSGVVESIIRSGIIVSAEIIYWAEYALLVHEGVRLGKNINFRSGNKKFLERPLMEALPTLETDIARIVKAVVGL